MRNDPQSHRLTIASVVFPAILAVAVLFLAPLFGPVLKQLGELPFASRTLLATYQWWFVLPLLFLLGAYTRWGKRNSKLLYNVSSAVTALLAMFVVWACYGPIFALASLAG